MKTEDIIQKQDELLNYYRQLSIPNDYRQRIQRAESELSSLKSMRDEKEERPAASIDGIMQYLKDNGINQGYNIGMRDCARLIQEFIAQWVQSSPQPQPGRGAEELLDAHKLLYKEKWYYTENLVKLMEEYRNQSEGKDMWISVKDKLPEKPGFYLVSATILQPLEEVYGMPDYKDETKIIYYFAERNVTGWQSDWTKKPHNVKYWMPLPEPPKS